MTFNSLTYALFLPLVFLIFTSVAERHRWQVLLVASYAFYASFKAPQLILALILVTGISYVCGRRLGTAGEERARKRIFWTGTGACLAILAVMKYLPPLLPVAAAHSPYAVLLLSIGVSYFALQAVSYLADIYLEIQEPEQHLGYHALALAFFPKLLQGPIERASDLLPQVRAPYRFSYETVRSGLILFAWGLFKKVVVADRLAQFVNPVFNDVHSYSGVTYIVVMYFYAIQLYCDFSGYTDMALGSARMFNIELTQNFNAPYLATSISDFWRRWHISFSRWILDYIFKPLQLAWRDHGRHGTGLALLITFLFSGIWHGSTWGFVIWGLLHGVYLAASTYYRPYQKKLHKALGIDKSSLQKTWSILVTFNLVCFAWLFFRAATVADALHMIAGIAQDAHRLIDTGYVKLQFRGLGLDSSDLAISLFFTGVVVLVNLLELRKGDIWGRLPEQPAWIRWPIYYMISLSIIYFSPYNTAKNFIYMQF